MAGHDPEPQAQIPTLRQLSGEAQAGLHQARFPEAPWEGRGRELFLAEAVSSLSRRTWPGAGRHPAPQTML